MQVAVREYRRHKEVEFLIACEIRVLLSALHTYFKCRGASVMSVCNVKRRDFLKQSRKCGYSVFVCYRPEHMSDAV